MTKSDSLTKTIKVHNKSDDIHCNSMVLLRGEFGGGALGAVAPSAEIRLQIKPTR